MANAVGFMTRRDAQPANLEVLFAPWPPSVPAFLSSQMVFAAHSVPPVVHTDAGDLDISSVLMRGWALKLGFGVFGVLAWGSDARRGLPAQAMHEITSFGWLPATGTVRIGDPPYNVVTAIRFSLLCSPRRIPGKASAGGSTEPSRDDL